MDKKEVLMRELEDLPEVSLWLISMVSIK